MRSVNRCREYVAAILGTDFPSLPSREDVAARGQSVGGVEFQEIAAVAGETQFDFGSPSRLSDSLANVGNVFGIHEFAKLVVASPC
jgi:hypothetical protein